MLAASVVVVGITGFFFSVFVQHVTLGAFVSGMTLITGPVDVVIALVKATLFGLSAGLIALLQGHFGRRRPCGRRQRRQRDRRVHLHRAQRHQPPATAVGVQVTT